MTNKAVVCNGVQQSSIKFDNLGIFDYWRELAPLNVYGGYGTVLNEN